MRGSLLLSFALAACPRPQTPPPEVVGDGEQAAAAAFQATEAELVAAMDTSADPCVDFYQYACGGWVENTELPADKPVISKSFTTISDQNRDLLKGILEAAATSPGDDADTQKVGQFYRDCMDVETINSKGVEPVLPLMQKVMALESRAGLWELTAELHLIGIEPFFSGSVWPDYKDPTYNRMGIGQGGLGLPDRDYFLKEDSQATEDAYEAYVADVLKMSGLVGEDTSELAKAVVKFELALAEIHLPRAELRDAEKTYHPMDQKALDALSPNLDWKKFLKASGYPAMDQFNVETPEYITALDALIMETELQTIQAYMLAHIATSTAPYLSQEWDERYFAFFGTTLSGTQQQQDRWKRCVARTGGALGEVLGKVYVERAFAGDSKAIAVDMITRIEREFEKGLAELDWMDDATRAAAVEKSQAITNKIGYPNTWRDYSGLELEAGNHLAQVLAGRAHTSKYYLDMVGNEVDKGIWYMTPQMVNAYYNPSANEIAFPAGILQPPFFSASYPKALNYGAIGMVMAHEVSHGFDDSGRKFSPTGALTEWWAPEVAERFEERAACIEEQYSGYEAQPDLFVNGKLTLGENIADLGGLKQAHRGYMTWLAESGGEPSMGGLTNEQLFFVGYAQGWCNVQTPELEKMRIRSDSHSPGRYRVNGPVRNLPAFGKAFECEVGSPLYPKEDEICVVW